MTQELETSHENIPSMEDLSIIAAGILPLNSSVTSLILQATKFKQEILNSTTDIDRLLHELELINNPLSILQKQVNIASRSLPPTFSTDFAYLLQGCNTIVIETSILLRKAVKKSLRSIQWSLTGCGELESLTEVLGAYRYVIFLTLFLTGM